MNTEITETEVSPSEPSADTAPQDSAKPGGGNALGLFALLLALAALTAVGWLWWQGQSAAGPDPQELSAAIQGLQADERELEQRVAAADDRLEQLAAQGQDPAVGELRGELAGQRAQIEALGSDVREQTALTRSITSSAEALHTRLVAAETRLAELTARNRDVTRELDLAELDFLLRQANVRLQLFADPVSADQALELAAAQLAAADNPVYLGLRREIGAVRETLAAVQLPDYTHLAGELDAVQQVIPELPFADERPVAAAPTPADGEGWWEKLKAALAGLVTVRRSTEEEDLKLGLQDKEFLRQRAWLQAETARLALMRRDQAAFGDALSRLRNTVDNWLDASNPQVQEMQQRLGGLAAATIAVSWPDISGPWTTLHAIRSAGGAAPAAAQPLAEPEAGGAGEAAAGEESTAGDGPE